MKLRPGADSACKKNLARSLRQLPRQKGQSVLEIALLAPVLLLMLVGTIEIGRYAYFAIEATNAARAGVQYGAQSLIDSKDVAGIRVAASNDAPDLMQLNVTAKDLCACSSNPSHYVGCPAQHCGAGHAVVFLQVNTTAQVPSLFHYPGLPATFSANGQAIMRVAQ
ncbi:MAG: TadE/TadG family type IV pilus assembly protein [Candidatus Acidiferrum sp.]|jgi:Flp pilus assembly protein TadG